jgi:hypothetical protein
MTDIWVFVQQDGNLSQPWQSRAPETVAAGARGVLAERR